MIFKLIVKLIMQYFLKPTATASLACLMCFSAQAQIIPDRSLGRESSQVAPNQSIKGTPSDLITGGAVRGENLFHSFQEFNINSDRGVYFANPNDIANIFSRVTGGNLSRIEGTLGVLGQANLFFLNPHGILFGANARIDLNGSFLATTASEIVFPGGESFDALNPRPVPILQISVPIGLGFTDIPSNITVQGTGHNLSIDTSPVFQLLPSPIIGAGQSLTGLRVLPKRNIALIGGNVRLEGGILTAPEGRIEIGSVKAGQVNFNFVSWQLNYSNIQNFQNIQLTNRALLDASGLTSGKISLQGNQIAVDNGSFVLLQSQVGTSGKIEVNATESLLLRGQEANSSLNPSVQNAFKGISSIASLNFVGQGSDINIDTSNLVIESGSNIFSASFVSGKSGNVFIDANSSIQVRGASSIDPLRFFSNINTSALRTSKSGNINLSTQELLLQNGGNILSVTFGDGRGGDIFVNASKSVLLEGVRTFLPQASVPSSLFSSSYGEGDAGNISINTSKLTVLDGASVSTSTIAGGDAGRLIINAFDSIQVSGFVDVIGAEGLVRYPSLITSAGLILDPRIQEILQLFLIVSGEAKDIQITTRELKVTDEASITVRNDGTGNAGRLQIYSPSILLKNSGNISAATASGQGGNIEIDSNDLRLNDNSSITATAGKAGDGGNIEIDTDTLVTLDNSNITANAFGGKGGSITINARGIFSDRPLNETFNASSELGIDGTVIINSPEIDIQKELEQLNPQVIPIEQVIARSCLTERNAQRGGFISSGNGGLPVTPETPIDEFALDNNKKPIAHNRSSQQSENASSTRNERAQANGESSSSETVYISSVAPWKPGDPIIAGQKLVRTKDGRLLFVAEASTQTLESAEELVCY